MADGSGLAVAAMVESAAGRKDAGPATLTAVVPPIAAAATIRPRTLALAAATARACLSTGFSRSVGEGPSTFRPWDGVALRRNWVILVSDGSGLHGQGWRSSSSWTKVRTAAPVPPVWV